MRLWSLHPSVLDRRALVAGWREALLAQKVLRGHTAGYTRHPQLERFRAAADPLAAMGAFLHATADEADRRGYSFDRSRIVRPAPAVAGPGQAVAAIPVTEGQLAYELALLRAKVEQRDPDWAASVLAALDSTSVRPHPLFTVVAGPVQSWERVKDLP